MKPADGLKDDVVNYVARMREEQYPELSDADVAKILEGLAKEIRYGVCYGKFRAEEECEAFRPNEPARQRMAMAPPDEDDDFF